MAADGSSQDSQSPLGGCKDKVPVLARKSPQVGCAGEGHIHAQAQEVSSARQAGPRSRKDLRKQGLLVASALGLVGLG